MLLCKIYFVQDLYDCFIKDKLNNEYRKTNLISERINNTMNKEQNLILGRIN